jgi:photosystem II stability/assembly factor-like uncharacterized protein
MSRWDGVLLALLAAVVSCSPLAKQTQPDHTTGTTPPPAPSVTAQPSPSPIPDPIVLDPTNPVAPGFLPHAVTFLDTDHGVIGGRIGCGQPCAGSGEGILAMTDDGGHTWRVTERLGRAITHLTHIEGTRVVWATASRCDYFLDDCARRLLRSSDGGATWTFANDALINPAFASRTVGFAATGDVPGGIAHGPIAITHDGGATWARRLGPCRGWQNMPVGFSFPSPTTGWLLCGSTDPGAGFFQFKAVYRTLDAGDTWIPMTRSSPDGSLGQALPPNGGALGIRMFDDGSGYVWAGGGDSTYLVITSDGGASWRAVWHGVDGGGSELTSISWLDPVNAYAIRWRSWVGFDLVVTSDGGASWSPGSRWPVRF